LSDSHFLILCIEVANGVTSVAISDNGVCMAEQTIPQANKAADVLHTQVHVLLQTAGLRLSDLQAVAVSAGPGSYTGLRIGVAAAKGYCFALSIPLIAVSSFEAMVEGIQNRYGKTGFDAYMPMIDARRMEVFTGIYSPTAEVRQSFSSLIVDETFSDWLKQDKILLFGNGAFKASAYMAGSRSDIMQDFQPAAADMCRLAYNRWMNGQTEDIAYYEPHYSKAFYTPANK